MKNLLILFFILILLLCYGLILTGDANAHSSQHSSISIIVYDAGETLGLLSITPFLEVENISVQWIPLTPWTLRLLEKENRAFVKPPKGLEIMNHLDDRQNAGEINYWLNLIIEQKPALVILGLVSRIQEQLACELRNRGIYTIGFYDGFDKTDRSSINWKVSRQVDEVWVPTKVIKHNLNNLGLKSVKVMGQPSLESWYRLAKEIRPDSLYKRLQISIDKKILIFAGQYGEGYKEILDAFMKVALEELKKREDLYLVLSPHPKTLGELECAVAQKCNHPRVLTAPKEVSTAELAAICKVMITWKSTVGVQATFMGKPVIYFNFNLDDYRNNLIDQGIAQVATPKTFGGVLQTFLDQHSDQSSNRHRLTKLGYIVDSDRKIASEILKRIRKH